MEYENESSALLREIVSLERKRLRHARFGTFVCLAVLAAVVIGCVAFGAQLANLLGNVESTVQRLGDVAVEAGELVREAGRLAENVGSLTADANEAVSDVDSLVKDNTRAVTEAIEKLNNLDFKRLNDAINDLADVVEPLANLTNVFR